MTVTEDQHNGHPLGADTAPRSGSAREAINQMLDAGQFDDVLDRADAGELALTGEGGFLPEMIKAVLERGLAAELTGHLGYERGDRAGRGSSNSRNGSSPKTVATEVGDVPLAVPRDRAGTFDPRLVPKGARRTGGGRPGRGSSTNPSSRSVTNRPRHRVTVPGVTRNRSATSTLDSPPAQASTIFDRNASACAVFARRDHRVSCSRSESVTTNSTFGPGRTCRPVGPELDGHPHDVRERLSADPDASRRPGAAARPEPPGTRAEGELDAGVPALGAELVRRPRSSRFRQGPDVAVAVAGAHSARNQASGPRSRSGGRR